MCVSGKLKVWWSGAVHSLLIPNSGVCLYWHCCCFRRAFSVDECRYNLILCSRGHVLFTAQTLNCLHSIVLLVLIFLN